MIRQDTVAVPSLSIFSVDCFFFRALRVTFSPPGPPSTETPDDPLKIVSSAFPRRQRLRFFLWPADYNSPFLGKLFFPSPTPLPRLYTIAPRELLLDFTTPFSRFLLICFCTLLLSPLVFFAICPLTASPRPKRYRSLFYDLTTPRVSRPTPFLFMRASSSLVEIIRLPPALKRINGAVNV